MKNPRGSFDEIQKRRRRKKAILKLALTLVLVGLAVFGAVKVVFYSSLFKFDNLIVNTKNDEDKTKIIQLLKEKIPQNSFLARWLGFNHFLAWPGSMTGSVLDSLPNIEALKIGKNYSDHALVIDVLDRKYFAIWCLKKNSPEECFWFDEKGTIFKESPSAAGTLVKVVFDYSQDSLGIGSAVIPEPFLSNLLSVMETVSTSGLSVYRIALNDLKLEEIEIFTLKGPKIYFSLRHPAENYLNVLKSLIANPSFDRLLYIDFRVLNRVFYQ